MRDIRHIATSYNGHIIALGEFEKRVQIFDIINQQIISEFDTVLDFGGNRLAISEDGKICICGCWEKYGICAYDTATGKLIWQRKDLKKSQKINLVYSDKTIIFVQFEVGKSRIIDINTGFDVDKLSGVNYYFQSPFDQIDVFDKSNKIQIINRTTSKVKANIQRQSFDTLDIAFTRNLVVVSETGAPLSCYETKDGKLKWRFPVIEGEHFLKVSYQEDLKQIVGVNWPFKTGGDKTLKFINQDNGIVEREIFINCPTQTEFALHGRYLITSDKEIINILSGEIIKCS